MCIVPLATGADTTPAAPRPCPAHQLGPQQRQQLAVQALAGQSVTDLAQQLDVRRKFVYQQTDRAQQALDHAFHPPPTDPEPVLFYLPVTRAWLHQFILAAVLI